MNLKTTAGIIIVLVLVLLGVSYGMKQYQASKPGQYDGLATCLKEQGVTFFGAFWCPHCKEQKEAFGNSAKLLPYVECSNPDGQTQTQACKDAGIEGYPTWEFADGSRLNGVITPDVLADKARCSLDGDVLEAMVASSTDAMASSTDSTATTSVAQ